VTAAAMLVLTTCGSAEEAQNLAAQLVGTSEAACVTRIDNVTSTYRWQGEVHNDQEILLLIKTTEDRVADVERTIRERSSYELPEVVAVRVDTGSPSYLDWLAGTVAEE
jgi:periplasmic divalent cation tolerance protein